MIQKKFFLTLLGLENGMMNKDKKQELAKMDERWNFKKTVKTRFEDDWDAVKNTFNWVQDNQGDLYMQVSKMDQPGRLYRLKMRYREFRSDRLVESVTFHHAQVYEWFEKLAYRLDCTVGEAVYKVEYEIDELRQVLDLGNTVTVEMNTMSEMGNPSESKVSKDELKEMIEDE